MRNAADYALAVAFVALALWWLMKPQKPLTTTEWRRRMRDLGIGTK